jgi:hypothetical protein
MGGQSTRPNIFKKKYHLRVQKYKDLATLDLRPMDEKTRLSSLYTIVNQTRQEQDDDYQSNQEEDVEIEWEKQNVVIDQWNFNCRTYNS